MREIEAGRRTEWRDISNRDPIYKNYWAQLKSLALKDDVFVRHWESDEKKKINAKESSPKQSG
jgi:hypothetical protein